MTEKAAPSWTFLTNHAQVLVCIAKDPEIRLREIAALVGITERAVHRIVVELADAGYLSRRRNGRRNQYTIKSDLPIHDQVVRDRSQNLGKLLEILGGGEPEPLASVKTAGA